MLKFTVGFLVFLGGSIAYDIGCLYPPKMPNNPHTARNQWSGGNLPDVVETPIIVHSDTLVHVCEMNCIAIHDERSLNMLTLERPFAVTPTEYHNTWSRNMCIFQCFGTLQQLPIYTNDTAELLAEWEFPFLEDNEDVFNCRSKECMADVMIQYDYDPRIIGQIVYNELLIFMKKDGWNSLGEYKFDHATGEERKCVSDCQLYADTIGYFPVNDPRRIRQSQKYSVEGTHRRWQPMRETDGYGNFKRQEHVVPHIGFTVAPFLFDEFKEADDPNYDYQLEAELVVNRTRDLASDEERKSKVRFYDQKLLVRGFLQTNMEKYRDMGLSYEDYLLYITGLGAVEHDAIVQCWREKVRFDLVRPTTVIHRWGTDPLYTYGGNPNSNEPENIEAHDFQAFVRVMPHAEYPSGSASLCTSYANYTRAFTLEFFNEEFGASYDLNDFNLPDKDFDIANLTELAEDCGESRLWGGMHFSASVQAGRDIVEGNGDLALAYALQIRNGSDWGNFYQSGDPRPTCNEE